MDFSVQEDTLHLCLHTYTETDVVVQAKNSPGKNLVLA